MRNDILKKIISILTLMSLLACMCGCSSAEDNVPGEDRIPVYYINNEETKTEAYYVDAIVDSPDAVVQKMLALLSEKDPNARYKAPLAMGFKVLDYTLDDGVLVLNMDYDYRKLEFTTEVLVRAAIVKTLCASGAVNEVYFTLMGEPLLDHSGFEVGEMNSGTFISNDGNEINTYEEADIRLFFTSWDGNYLIGVYRNKFYSTSMPLERFVVDELISGPSGQVEGIYPSINPQTSVLNVNTKDGVCYVNLSSDFLIPYGNVPTSVSVLAIVDSLCALPAVDRVQIMVDGVVPETLESSYEYNDDVVITIEEALEMMGSPDGQ